MMTICNAARSLTMTLAGNDDEQTAQALRDTAARLRLRADDMPPSIADQLLRAAAEFERRAAEIGGGTAH